MDIDRYHWNATMTLDVLFLDLNSYFASVEQQLRPELRGRPVAVAPVEAESTCCIAASYEAKAFGVKTGTGVREAKQLCPRITIVQARPEKCIETHHAVVAAVDACAPVEAIHSIDELHCRLSRFEREPTEAIALAERIKQMIAERVGEHLRSSIGIAPNRFLAKVGTELDKPDGLVVIEKQELPDKLFSLELRDLPGIGPRMHARLQRRNITTVEQLCHLSENELVTIWQSVLGRIWYRWLRGEPVWEPPTHRRSIGHQHVLPPEYRTHDGSRGVLIRLLTKAAVRLRSLDYWARRLTVSIRLLDRGAWSRSARLAPTQDTLTLLDAFRSLWPEYLPGAPLRVAVTLDELESSRSAAMPLFPEEQRRTELAKTIDRINARHGKATLYPGSMHDSRTAAPMRIPFQTIPDLQLGA